MIDKEKKHLYDLNYYRKNAVMLRKKSSIWQKEHPETVKSRMKAYLESGRHEAARLKRTQETKEILDLYKADKGCLICGERDPVVLDFHHIDPSQKKDCIARLKYRSLSGAIAEAGKCAVLCSNCHRRVTAGTVRLDDYLLKECGACL